MSVKNDIVMSGVLSTIILKLSARAKLFLLILFFFYSNILFTQIEDFKFINVSSNNSLSHSSVQCMVQDSLGFMWIGTNDGLNLFDGYDFRYYKYDPAIKNSISHNDISSLAIQQNQYLWIGTRGGGVNRMDLRTGMIDRFSYDLFDGIVHCIFVDFNNTVWIGTSSGLLKCIEDKEKRSIEFKNISSKAVFRKSTNEPFIPDHLNRDVRCIYQSVTDKLIIGTGVGVFVFNINNDEFHQISYHLNYFNGIANIEEDKKGNLWISHSLGVSKIAMDIYGKFLSITDFNSDASIPKRISHDKIKAMVIDDSGRIWLGTHGAGLVFIENDSVIYINDIIDPYKVKLESLINTLYIDKNGTLWIGQRNYPLVLNDPKANKFKTLFLPTNKDKVSKDFSIQSITGKGDKIWLASSYGIDILKYNNNSFVHVDNIPNKIRQEIIWNNDFNALFCDRENILWIGSSINSFIGIKPNGEFIKIKINGYTYTIAEENDERIWFGTWGQGIGYYNKKTGKTEQYNLNPKRMMGLSSHIVISMYIDSRGYLWVGTKGGGLNVAPIKDVIERKGHFVIFNHEPLDENAISYDDINDIIETKDGEIWIATGRGLNKVLFPQDKTIEEAIKNKLLKFEKITEKDGLPSSLILSLLEDNKGNLWLGTNIGLCKFVPSTKQISVFNPDGLSFDEFYKNSAYKDPKTGLLFFGGFNGMIYFHPDEINQNPSISSPRLTEIKVLNKTITPQTEINGRLPINKNIFFAEKIHLKHNENDLSFEFSALNYTYSDKIRYSYRLLGYNDNWYETDSKNRRITYTNLHSGSYVLEVRGTNSDGVWAKDKIVLNIRISPPYWLTWWAYGFYLVLLIISLVLFRRYSIIAVNEKNKLQLAKFEQNKNNEIFEAKTRFFINVSHEIKTPLTLIHEPLNQLLTRSDLPIDALESAKMIRRNLKRLLNQVNQLLEFRKMEKNKYVIKYSEFLIEEVIKDILAEFEVIIQHKEINIIQSYPNNLLVEADKQLIETILYNLISNSLNHLPNRGELKIELLTNETSDSVKPGLFKMLVSDNGPGIPEEDIIHVFERFFQSYYKNNLNTGGTGIGLSIVKEYVEQHKGNVKVYNLISGGCCFDVTIPLKGEDELVKEHTIELPTILPNKEEKDEDIESHLSKLTSKSLSMVIIEDDLDLSLYLKDIFSKQFNITVFMNGLEASNKIKDLSPDIIICDLMLPGMNGMDLTVKLKEDLETSHIPIIMLTAIHEEESMTKGLVSGADCYLTKPFNTNTLKAQVVSIIKSREKFKERFSNSLVLEPTENVILTKEEKFIKKIMDIIERRLEDSDFEVPDIVQEMAMSHTLLLKKFKAITGLSLVEFIRSIRIKKAVQLFKQDKFTVSEVAYRVGFSDPKYFSKCFYNEIGEKPSDFVKKYHY